ncbi:MAG: hypothetical protein F6J89_31080, partial [Symploca sp. SIO1C4]|nr:hypothetical protein [Symploca sp. SIO1C4]
MNIKEFLLLLGITGCVLATPPVSAQTDKQEDYQTDKQEDYQGAEPLIATQPEVKKTVKGKSNLLLEDGDYWQKSPLPAPPETFRKVGDSKPADCQSPQGFPARGEKVPSALCPLPSAFRVDNHSKQLNR